MFSDIHAVIFDMDGTIIDSMWVWKRVDEEFLLKRSIDLPFDIQRQIEGLSFTDTARYFKDKFLLSEDIEDIKNEWIHMVEKYYKDIIPLKDGALQLILKLKETGLKIGLATSNSKELTEMVLKRTGVFDYFDYIVTSCEVGKNKSCPDIFLMSAKNLGISPENCLVFEDSIAGIMGAKRAGMRVIAVYDEYSKLFKKELQDIADLYISSLQEIA